MIALADKHLVCDSQALMDKFGAHVGLSVPLDRLHGAELIQSPEELARYSFKAYTDYCRENNLDVRQVHRAFQALKDDFIRDIRIDSERRYRLAPILLALCGLQATVCKTIPVLGDAPHIAVDLDRLSKKLVHLDTNESVQ